MGSSTLGQLQFIFVIIAAFAAVIYMGKGPILMRLFNRIKYNQVLSLLACIYLELIVNLPRRLQRFHFTRYNLPFYVVYFLSETHEKTQWREKTSMAMANHSLSYVTF